MTDRTPSTVRMPMAMTVEEQMLKESARRFLKDFSGPGFQQEAHDNPVRAHGLLWNGVAELGWLGLRIEEAYGGVQMDFTSLAILLEEMGRVCLPGPFFSAVVGSMLISEIASDAQKRELLPSVAEGATVLTIALTETFSEFDPDIQTTARQVGREFVLDGRKLLVPYGEVADLAISLARFTSDRGGGEAGVGVFAVPLRDPTVGSERRTEISGCISNDVTLSGLRVPQDALLGGKPIPWSAIERILLKAAVAKCAEMVGGAQRAMEIAVEHAKERRQFGKAIGSFQAVQHHCSNMLVHVETARRLTEESVCLIDKGALSDSRAAATKIWCNHAYREVVRLAHQVMGGAGYIDDHMMPWHFRHARACETTLGDSDALIDVVANELYADATGEDVDRWPSLFASPSEGSP